ncbi:MAG: flagellar hook-associated protein FlgK [Paracoccus sp. (in: a-proteobacteria)]|nr:flagellar hook-associated protein FlgK [Paracoccus sp. (in: a-proteobacteria)]
MGISGAISNAVSGLTAVGRGTQVVSSNLSNALTPGYGKREIQLSPRVYGNSGGGVRVDGISRAVSDSALAAMRLSSASYGESETRASYAARVEKLVGTATDPGSLGAQVAQLDKTLTDAISRPDSEVRLNSAVNAARDLVNTINGIGRGIEQLRTDADSQIATQVDTLNSAFEQVEDLNRKIVTELARTGDAASLMDQRQKVIDDISSILPIKALPREYGRIALFTEAGQPLLDGSKPFRIGFNPAGIVTAEMSIEDGTLSGLTLDGEAPAAVQIKSLMGGTLGALFGARDSTSVKMQASIDAFAQELHARFNDASMDPSLPPGGPGLFSDNGHLATATPGLALKLSLNPSVDPNQSGAVWRLRDGIGATAQGPAGNSTLLAALSTKLNQNTVPTSPALGTSSQSLSTIAGSLMTNAASARVLADAAQSRSAANHSATTQAVLAEGVDTDREMENLLMLEKAYAANARVIQTAFDMLDNILRI